MSTQEQGRGSASELTQLLACSRCGEDALAVELPDGSWFVRLRRAGKCKNYPMTRDIGKSCKTEPRATKNEAIAEWNTLFSS